MRIETIFEFVRFAMDGSNTEFQSSDDLDWTALYDFALKQSIVGVLFSGVEKMPAEQKPERKLLMKWYMQSERIRKKNVILNAAVLLLSRQFSGDGFPVCILKGQGNALMYPVPGLRTPGDVDLWPLADRGRIFKYVRKDFPKTEMLYHHLEYPKLKGIVAEVHFLPMYLNNPLYNRRFQKWVKSVAQEQCSNRVELTKGSFCRPTREFNAIYQLAHIRHHFFDEGVGMRQLMDYYYVLRSEEVVARHEELRRLLRSFGLSKFAGALMYAMDDVFKLDSRYWLAEPDERIGRMLIEEILMTGNFGHKDSRFGNLKSTSRSKRMFALQKKNFRFWRHFPSEVFFAFLFRLLQPVWRIWADYRYSK